MLKKSLFALACTTFISAAQENAPFQTSYSHQFENNSGTGSVSIDRWDARGGVPLYMNGDTLLALGVRYAQDHYDFNGTLANWGTIQHTNLGVASRWRINDKWLWANYGIATISAERGADRSNAFNYTFLSIAEYKVNDKLTIGPGLGISSELDRGKNLFPIFTVEWQINDEWQLLSGPSEVTTAGANVYAKYTPKALNNKWAFSSGFSYTSSNFRLDAPGGILGGSGEESLASVYLAATYNINDKLKLSAIAGYQLGQEFRQFDSNGTQLTKETLDGAPYLGITLGYEF